MFDDVTWRSCSLFPQGFAKAMSGFVKLGLINGDPCPLLAVDAPVVSWVSNYSYYTLYVSAPNWKWT